MKRIERPPLVIYVERDRLGSLLFLWMSMLLAPVAWGAREAVILRDILWAALVLSTGAAFVLLFRARLLAIDRDAGEVRILARAVPWRTLRIRIPLERAFVWENERRQPSSVLHEVCIAKDGGRPWVVQSSHSREAMARLARQLAADLGRPLWEPPVAAPPSRG